ncbi:unnamed protein product [Cylindrotheca closterium]|uniref:G2/mitotic-specific cyclin-B3 n=1 Tax=Cylindrotheca closterium TaxID=2856 RepID=A0AAD2FBX0_9STRA|nr:unnamed protein product [Cylindrotheca closterium]
MTDKTNMLDKLRALVKKELTDYATMSSLPSHLSPDVEEEESSNANGQRQFSIRIGAKRRRLQQRSDTETDTNEEVRGIHPKWRVKMIQWAFKVVDHLDLDREIVAIAINYLDRFCLEDSRPNGIDRRTLQLLTLTSLYIAIKLFEFRAIRASDGDGAATTTLETLLLLTGSPFTKQEMESMEYEILDALQWQVHPPTEQIFIAHFMSAMPPCDSRVQRLSLYLAELSLLDSFFASYRTSETAYAALLFSRGRVLHNEETPFSLKLSQSRHHDYDIHNPRIRECYERLSDLFRNSEVESAAESANDNEDNGRVASPVSVTASIL